MMQSSGPPSELIRQPRGKEIDVFAWCRVHEKRSGKEVRVISSRCQVPIHRPVQLQLRVRSNVTIPSEFAGAFEIDRYTIEAVLRALSPKKVYGWRQSDLFRQVQVRARMQVHEVHRTQETFFPEVRSFREQRIETLKVRISRVLVAARHISPETETRLPGCVPKRVTGVRSYGPSANVTGAKRSPLINCFEVVIQT